LFYFFKNNINDLRLKIIINFSINLIITNIRGLFDKFNLKNWQFIYIFLKKKKYYQNLFYKNLYKNNLKKKLEKK